MNKQRQPTLNAKLLTHEMMTRRTVLRRWLCGVFGAEAPQFDKCRGDALHCFVLRH
jgi:hypothetical protein